MTPNTGSLTIESTIRFEPQRRGRKQLTTEPARVIPLGRVPRISKLMALAIRLDELVRTGAVTDFAELARRGHVTRARISQILSLQLLAPDIQEELLFLPRIERGRDTLCLRKLLPIAAEPDWKKQRGMWKKLKQQMES
jgi:hypothetical protein